jgi:hypothetical protein
LTVFAGLSSNCTYFVIFSMVAHLEMYC